MLSHLRKIDRLIMAMITAYWKGFHRPGEEWVPHTELAKITVAYSQRFGEWYVKSNENIKVEKRSDGDNNYSYRLKTCPDKIDWDTLKAVVPHQRIRRTGRVLQKVETQEGLFE